jgi:hypothetical protein
VNVGTWKKLPVAKVGDQQVGIVLNPTDTGTGTPVGSATRLVAFRDGVNVVLLSLRDDDQSKAGFDKLAVNAGKQARAAT